MHGSFKSKRLSEQFRMDNTGPGGWKCNCCGPAPKDRTKWCRRAKKNLRRFLDADLRLELNEL